MWHGILTLFEPHNVHGVQGIYQGEAHIEPLRVLLGDWFKLIVAPGVFLVGIPGVFEGGHNSSLSMVLRSFKMTI